MSNEAWIAIGAACVFVGGAFVYVMFMVFLPEWVGIAGDVAQAAERSHQGEGGPAAPVENKQSLLDRMQRDSRPKR